MSYSMKMTRDFQDRVKFYERERGLSFRDAMQSALNEFIGEERERCIKILHEAYANHKGASVQTAFPEDTKILLANMARVLGEMENEMRERVKKGLDCACGGYAPEICPTKDAEHIT